MCSAASLPRAAVDKLPSKREIHAVIEASGMTHAELAEWLGVSKSGVHKWASSAEDNVRQLPMPVWALLLLLTDQHPTLRLAKRR